MLLDIFQIAAVVILILIIGGQLLERQNLENKLAASTASTNSVSVIFSPVNLTISPPGFLRRNSSIAAFKAFLLANVFSP